MAWKMVRQPNGFFARWSDVVDSFTHFDIDPENGNWGGLVGEYGLPLMQKKIGTALGDDVWGVVEEKDGLNRWRDCLAQAEIIHGIDHISEILTTMGIDPFMSEEP